VVVIGDVMLDVYWHGTVRRLSPEAPVPVVEGVEEERRAGGAANVAVQLAALDHEVVLAGVVGNDAAAGALDDALAAVGVRRALVVDRARPTTTKQRILSGGQQLLRVDRDAPAPLPAAVEDELVTALLGLRPTAVVVSDYAKGVLTPGVARAIAALAVPTVVDTKGRELALLRGWATVLTSNEREVRRATGAEALPEALERARAALPGTALLVTRGEEGMVLDEPGAPALSLPSSAESVVDVTGAGDIVTAYMAHALAEGRTLHEGARLANAAAGIGVRRLGAAVVALPEARAALAPAPRWATLREVG
jgi:D-beta-D-heptose 7-phosphate kinase/D-beta-D-heptose 1-phosphate adenosyltransferase